MSTSPDSGRPSPEHRDRDGQANGRSLVTGRAVVDLVRSAVRTSYGVTGVDRGGPLDRLLGLLGVREPGIRVHLDGDLEIDLRLTVAYGLPIAEVARQVDSAVRYTIRRALERDVDRLTIHVDGLRYHPASVPPAPVQVSPPRESPLPLEQASTGDGAARESRAHPVDPT